MMLFGIVRIEEKDLRHYIKDISTGNKAALMQFYRNYGQSILNMILSTVNSRESAEEVLQDVLMVLVTHNPDKTIKNVKGWFFTVIRNLSLKKAKEDKITQTGTISEYEYIPSGENIFDNIENSVEEIESLQCLDPLERQCVIMCIYGQMKLPQVAELLGMPYKKVCNKFDYAVRKLRKYYEERK